VAGSYSTLPHLTGDASIIFKYLHTINVPILHVCIGNYFEDILRGHTLINIIFKS